MSIGNGDNGDDDIDRLIDEMRETNKRLDALLEALVRGGQAEEVDEEVTIDNATTGGISREVSTVEGYISQRHEAATSDSVLPPSPRDVGMPKYEFYFEVFKEGGENMNIIRDSLSEEHFDKFIQLYAIHYGISEEMIDMLDSSAEFFGIRNPSTLRPEFKVEFIKANSMFTVLKIYNDLWYWPPEDRIATNPELLDNIPPITLRLRYPEGITDENTVILTEAGTLGVDEINRKLARIIVNKRDDLELSPELRRRFL